MFQTAQKHRVLLTLSLLFLAFGVVALATEARLPQTFLRDGHCLSQSTRMQEASTGQETVERTFQPVVTVEEPARPEPPLPMEAPAVPRMPFVRTVDFRPPPSF